MLDKLFRFSIRDGAIGGVVIANTLNIAKENLMEKYPDYNVDDFLVWAFKYDDYYDEDYPGVIEYYGL